MTKPEDIPQDIIVLARKAIMAEVSADVRWQYASGENDHFAVVRAIARAIMAERERCATAAKSSALGLRGWPVSEEQADEVAAAIRGEG